MLYSKTFLLGLVLTFQTLAISSLAVPTTFSTTTTLFTDLSKNWSLSTERMISMSDVASFYSDDSYWGVYKTTKTTTTYRDTLDTLGIGCYYRFDNETRFHYPTLSIPLKADIDSVKAWCNRFSFNQDTLDSHFRLYKTDSIHIAIAIPLTNKVKIYKNYKDSWNLKTIVNTPINQATLKDFHCIDNVIYFSSSNYEINPVSNAQLYKVVGANYKVIATGILGYFVDNNGVWTTNSSGELSYYNGTTQSIVKTNPIYAQSVFAVCPVDTTFFYGSKIENSYYGHVSYGNVTSYKTFIDDDNNIINNNTIIFSESKYKKLNSFPMHFKNPIYNKTTQELTGVFSSILSNKILIYKINFSPFFNETEFVDSLGYLNESTKNISYKDTLRAFDCSKEGNISFSIIENPIGLTIVDSIITLPSSIPVGTYRITFQVKDDFYSPLSENLSWNLKIYSRKIEVSKNVLTTSTENALYTQTITTTDIDNDSSFIHQSFLPSWLSIERASKNQFVISGTPSHTSIDTSIKIIVTDNSTYFDVRQNSNVSPSYDTLTFSLVINKINVAPVFTSTPIVTGSENQQYIYQVVATDDQPFTYSFGICPTGMTISSTGLITWLPTSLDTGRHLVSVLATDTHGAKKQHNYLLTISNINIAPIFTFITPNVTIRETDSITLEAIAIDHDGTIPIVTWYKGETLIGQGANYKFITNYTSAGIDTIKVIASDGDLSVTNQIIVTVLDKNRAPITNNDTTLFIRKLNEPVVISVKAIDLDGDLLIYSYDASKFNLSDVVVDIKDLNLIITLKKFVSDTITFSVSDGKDSTSFKVNIIAEVPTSIISKGITLINSFNIDSKGTIKYTVSKTSNVRLIIYSINGSILYKNNKMENSGVFNTKLNLTTGTYVYRFMIGNDYNNTHKIQIIN